MAALLVPVLIFLTVRVKKKALQEAKEQEEMLAQQEDIITNLIEKYGINDDEESRNILRTLRSRSFFDSRWLPRLTKSLLNAMAETYYTKKNITDNDLQLFIEYLSAAYRIPTKSLERALKKEEQEEIKLQ